MKSLINKIHMAGLLLVMRVPFLGGPYYLLTASLVKHNLLKLSAAELYKSFVSGQLGERWLFRLLSPDQVEEFVRLHQYRKRSTQAVSSFALPTPESKRKGVRMAQLDRIIEAGLEDSILRGQGSVNVVRRIN